MKFRTEYEPTPYASSKGDGKGTPMSKGDGTSATKAGGKGGRAVPGFGLDPARALVLMGSCFSDNIGRKFVESGWDVAVNPCGTLFNPSSIAASLLMALSGSDPTPICLDNRWTTWDFPTRWSAADPESCLAICRDSRNVLLDYLTSSQALIATFGTAWVYELADTPGRVVANCQKQPESLFTRRLLSPEEIVETWTRVIAALRQVNPRLKVIFTVSPVRHLRDGFAGNSLSKATLILAVNHLVATLPETYYFPAFEIVNDDLRDYRFYGADLVHPSEQAVDYIWEKLCATCLDDKSRNIVSTREAALRRSRHRDILPL